jgi:hypothetical protein
MPLYLICCRKYRKRDFTKVPIYVYTFVLLQTYSDDQISLEKWSGWMDRDTHPCLAFVNLASCQECSSNSKVTVNACQRELHLPTGDFPNVEHYHLALDNLPFLFQIIGFAWR